MILSLAEKLYICSRLLTCAAMRLEWDAVEVRELVAMVTPKQPPMTDRERHEAHGVT